MFQQILDVLLPYIGDVIIGIGAFFGVRVTFSPKKSKEEKAALKRENQITKTKLRAAKLSAKLSSCVQFLQSQVNEKESDSSGDSSN